MSSKQPPTEAEISAQLAVLEAVGDGLGGAVLLYDRNDELVFYSRRVLELYPIPVDCLTKGARLRDILGAIYDTGLRSLPQGRRGQAAGREDWVLEKIAAHWRERHECIERLGTDRWVRVTKRRLPNGYCVSVTVDVSEDKRREEQWRADVERIQLTEDILDNLPFPISVKDRNLAYVAVNIAYCENQQVSVEEVIGRRGSDIFTPELAARFEERDRHVLETGEMSVVVQRHVSRDGVERNYLSRRQRIGKPGRYFVVSTLQELDLGQSGPEGASEEPASSVATHRLQGGAGMSGAGLETIVAEHLGGRRVLLVTADLAAEAAALRLLSRQGFEACAIGSAEEQEQFLSIAAHDQVRIDLLIVDNQMDILCLEVAERFGLPCLVLDGFQIANELTFHIARYFNRRHQASGCLSDDMDFEINTGNEPDDLDVLVAEDNEINQIVFSQILEGLGYRYAIVDRAEDAVRLCAERRPRIVLMDISLPGGNGYEATRKIRASETGQAHLPIIGVLSHAFDTDRQSCLDAGMDDVILKPVSPDMLEALFQRHIGLDVERAAHG